MDNDDEDHNGNRFISHGLKRVLFLALKHAQGDGGQLLKTYFFFSGRPSNCSLAQVRFSGHLA